MFCIGFGARRRRFFLRDLRALVRAAGASFPGKKPVLEILSLFMSFGACRAAGAFSPEKRVDSLICEPAFQNKHKKTYSRRKVRFSTG